MKEVKLFLNYAGYCLSKESHAITGGANKNIRFPALYGLVLHPEKGWILIDTGYSTRFYESTKRFPNSLHRKATKVFVSSKDEIKSQLKGYNIDASDIKHVIITHFHADHIGGMKDFENAVFYCSKAAFNQANSISQYWGWLKGILKDLIPNEIYKRVRFIDEICLKLEDEIFGYKFDLWGDQSLFIYELPGHAAGQIGVFLKTNKRKYFLVSDACWLKKSYSDFVLPHPIVRLIVDSWKQYKSSLKKITEYNKHFPNVLIVPSHCTESTVGLVSNTFDINAL